jgi:MOSC domain-containing protein YiiM
VAGVVLQLNVSPGGVPKRAVGEANVNVLGIEGDLHAHPQIHGGPRQALLIITSEGIAELIAQGFPLFYGALGENLTTEGVDRREFRLGQRWRAGDVIFEFTKPRGPCETLNIYGPGLHQAIYDREVKAGNPASPRWGLSGLYAAVVSPGTIRAGDPLVLLDQAV